MRQPGNEFRQDPYKSDPVFSMTDFSVPASFQKDHQKWGNNATVARQHKFCANLCVNFKSGTEISSSEQNCMNTCFSKYSQALGFFA